MDAMEALIEAWSRNPASNVITCGTRVVNSLCVGAKLQISLRKDCTYIFSSFCFQLIMKGSESYHWDVHRCNCHMSMCVKILSLAIQYNTVQFNLICCSCQWKAKACQMILRWIAINTSRTSHIGTVVDDRLKLFPVFPFESSNNDPSFNKAL